MGYSASYGSPDLSNRDLALSETSSANVYHYRMDLADCLGIFKGIETAGGSPPAAILQIVMVSVIPVVFYLSMHQAEQPAVT